MLWLLVRSLATWRISNMLYQEEGPYGILKGVREKFGVEHDEDGPLSYPDGSVFACLGCLSIWVGLGVGFLPRSVQLALASSAGAIFLHKLLERLGGPSFDRDDAPD